MKMRVDDMRDANVGEHETNEDELVRGMSGREEGESRSRDINSSKKLFPFTASSIDGFSAVVQLWTVRLDKEMRRDGCLEAFVGALGYG